MKHEQTAGVAPPPGAPSFAAPAPLVACPSCRRAVGQAAFCAHCGANLTPGVPATAKPRRRFEPLPALGGGFLILVFASFHAGYWDAMWFPILAGLAGGAWAGSSGFRAWPRVALVLAVLVLLLPLSVAVYGGGEAARLTEEEGSAAGAGAALGTGLAVALVGIVSLLIGIVLLALAYFGFNRAKEREKAAGAPAPSI